MSPYGLGLIISASAFNQLLGSMTECGILNQDVNEISLGGPPVPITSCGARRSRSAVRPKLPPNTPMRMRVTPTAGPFLTANRARW